MAKWFIQRNGKQAGPFVSAQLKQLASEGKIRPEDQIRRDDQDKWHNAEKVKGLFSVTSELPSEQMNSAVPNSLVIQPTNSDTDQVPDDQSSVGEPSTEGKAKSEKWFCLIEDEEIGPISFVTLCKRYLKGKIENHDLIASEGMQWIEAGVFLEPAVLENATSADEWFITSGENVRGPFPFQSLLEMHKAKQLSEADLIGRKGSKGHSLGFLFVDQASKSPNRLLPILILVILFGAYRYYTKSGSSKIPTNTRSSNKQTIGQDGTWKSSDVKRSSSRDTGWMRDGKYDPSWMKDGKYDPPWMKDGKYDPPWMKDGKYDPPWMKDGKYDPSRR